MKYAVTYLSDSIPVEKPYQSRLDVYEEIRKALLYRSKLAENIVGKYAAELRFGDRCNEVHGLIEAGQSFTLEAYNMQIQVTIEPGGDEWCVASSNVQGAYANKRRTDTYARAIEYVKWNLDTNIEEYDGAVEPGEEFSDRQHYHESLARLYAAAAKREPVVVDFGGMRYSVEMFS